MSKKSILITGGAGFIGSNFIEYYLKSHTDCIIVNLDKLTYAGDLNNTDKFKNNKNYIFVQGDICDSNLVNSLFTEYDIRDVFHFAAESHVDNSISNPGNFIDTNINGTYTLVHSAYKHWMEMPFKYKKSYQSCKFLHVSTDEVYGTLGKTGLFSEETPYAPNSPYSASKASSDFIIRSYFHTYGLNTITTNCSNNYGPQQHKEKLIPTIIRKALNNEEIPIYGNGSNIRDWLYVLDHCRGINLVHKNGKIGETYNIGGRNERTNLDICHTICKILDQQAPKSNGQSYSKQITFVKDRPGHDFRYAINANKIETQLNWKAEENFESGIIKTVQWYLKGKA